MILIRLQDMRELKKALLKEKGPWVPALVEKFSKYGLLTTAGNQVLWTVADVPKWKELVYAKANPKKRGPVPKALKDKELVSRGRSTRKRDVSPGLYMDYTRTGKRHRGRSATPKSSPPHSPESSPPQAGPSRHRHARRRSSEHDSDEESNSRPPKRRHSRSRTRDYSSERESRKRRRSRSRKRYSSQERAGKKRRRSQSQARDRSSKREGKKRRQSRSRSHSRESSPDRQPSRRRRHKERHDESYSDGGDTSSGDEDKAIKKKHRGK